MSSKDMGGKQKSFGPPSHFSEVKVFVYTSLVCVYVCVLLFAQMTFHTLFQLY